MQRKILFARNLIIIQLIKSSLFQKNYFSLNLYWKFPWIFYTNSYIKLCICVYYLVYVLKKYFMGIVSCIIWVLLNVIGLIGSVVPWIPWPQLAYLAIILIQIFMNEPFSWWFIVVRWVVMVLLIVIDYYLPILWTKKFGWSKWGNRWCIIWMVVWLCWWALGLILWPFLWALIWEYLHQKNTKVSIKAAFGSFLWFLSWVLLKLFATIILIVYFCIWCYNYFVSDLDSNNIWENAVVSEL